MKLPSPPYAIPDILRHRLGERDYRASFSSSDVRPNKRLFLPGVNFFCAKFDICSYAHKIAGQKPAGDTCGKRISSAALRAGLRVIEASARRRALSIADAAKDHGLDRADRQAIPADAVAAWLCNYDEQVLHAHTEDPEARHAYLRRRRCRPLSALLDSSRKAGRCASASVLPTGPRSVYVARASQRRVMSINLTPRLGLPALLRPRWGRVFAGRTTRDRGTRIISDVPT